MGRISRRLFIAAPIFAQAVTPLRSTQPKPRVACILNAYFPNSHADVFVSRLLDGYRLNHAWHDPRLEVVSFYVDQFPANDLAREQAEEHGIKIYPSVAEALRLGGSQIAVDAVAAIGEHGVYPRTPRGNFMYPRWRYFDEITRVMREESRVLPMYQDKYFAYEWADARRTYDRVREMRIPFMCGSTVPLSWQRPPLNLDRGVSYSQLLTTTYSDIEEHAYHGIELLQAMAERRAGGETGVARVRWCKGDDVWSEAAKGDWSRELLDAALTNRINPVPAATANEPPEAFLIEYRDGLSGAVLHVNSLTRDYLFAARLKGRAAPVSTCFYIQLNLHNHWSFMVRNFEDLVLTHKEPNPIERTLVANGIMLAGLESRTAGRNMGRYAGTRDFLLIVVCAARATAADYSVLDVQKIPLTGDAAQAVIHVSVPDQVPEITCDVLVAGAGMGGIGASLALSAGARTVCLTEETDWVGGQATAGGVPALDENRFIEFAGGTRSYMEFRRGIRDWYRNNTQLTPAAKAWENLNPGTCYVSPLCFEPKVGVTVLEQMLHKPGVNLYLRTVVFALEKHDAHIESALAWQFDQQRVVRFRMRFVLDATEMGDLLPLAKVPYVVGSEAKSETGEPDAPAAENKSCVQSFTYPFAIEHGAGSLPVAGKPEAYDQILKRQNFSLRVNYPEEFGWKGWVQYHMFGEDPPVPNNMSPGPFFAWRRLRDARNFENGSPPDLALMNWPRQDYGAESPLDREPSELAGIFQRAKQTSAAFLYWLRHDVPRDDKTGTGYPELTLRADVMDSVDGMSKYPYIRESRRMLARGKVTEQDIVDQFQTGPRARSFADSVGTGFYMVDIHPCGANEHGRMRMPKPFQIPMAALMPRDGLNFLPASKNIGVTHLTNGAFRLHPVEWNIGEAAGTIAALWLEQGREPAAAQVQLELAKQGVPMVWFDDLGADNPAFAAIQLAALRGIYPMHSAADLHASPDAPVTRGEAAVAISARFGKRLNTQEAIKFVVQAGWMATDHRNWFHEDIPFYWTDWREDKLQARLPTRTSGRTGPVRRWELAARLTATN